MGTRGVAPGSGGQYHRKGRSEPFLVAVPTTLMEDFLMASDVQVRYRTGGKGESILLLHGWGASMNSFRQVFDDLAKNFHVVALDFPGHGASGMPPIGWTVSNYMECLLSIMDQLALPRPSIVAHSFGGRVAIKLAAAHPDRVGRLILVDAAGVPPPRSFRFKLKRSLARLVKRITPYLGAGGREVQRRVYALIQSSDYAATTGTMRDTFVKVISEDLTASLPKIKSPTLLVWGDQDKDTPPVSGETMNSLIPHSEYVLLKGAGHFSYIDQFNLFRLLVRRFMLTPLLPE